MEKLVIAIDGTAGSGKGTAGKMIADKLNINYVSTGAVFRALGLFCARNNLDATNQKVVEDVCSKNNIEIKFVGGEQHTYLNGEDVSGLIHSAQAGVVSAQVGFHAISHHKAAEIVRALAKECSIVVDGREIGSFMLPNATVKFYLDASPEERANRRFLQVKEGEGVTYNQILEQIVERDRLDMTRENFPLIKCEDAVVVDSTNKPVEKVVEEMLTVIKEKVANKEK